jgi:anti-sigma-K factor RskA
MSHNKQLAPSLDCDTIQELIPDYVFGLTTPEETRLVESNLTACPEAAAELEDYRRLQTEMRAGAPQVEPSRQIRERLLTVIADAPATASQPPRRTIHPAWWAAIAALFILAITNFYWMMRVDDLVRRHDELVAMLGGQGDNAFVLTSTRDLRWVRLPSETDDETSAYMMWNAESETGLMYVHAFPMLEPGKTYQLWLTRGDERVSAGTFEVDEEGNASLLFQVTEPIDQFTWARVTAEPVSGSEQPSDTVVVHGEL